MNEPGAWPQHDPTAADLYALARTDLGTFFFEIALTILNPDHRRRQLLEKRLHLFAPQFLVQHHLLGGVHSVKLEKMFRRVHPDSANLFHGRPLLSEISNDLILAQSMPPGAVHTNSSVMRLRICLEPNFAVDDGLDGARTIALTQQGATIRLLSARRGSDADIGARRSDVAERSAAL